MQACSAYSSWLPEVLERLSLWRETWFSSALFRKLCCLTHLVCHTCFKRHEKLHRCGQCKFAHYCDRTCQKEGWVNHKSECSAVKKQGKAPNENIRGHGPEETQLGEERGEQHASLLVVAGKPEPRLDLRSQWGVMGIWNNSKEAGTGGTFTSADPGQSAKPSMGNGEEAG
ncbi:UNVERIFIED_CONTAM: hypothetical protein K2H54_056998 [Gekko kuhli]